MKNNHYSQKFRINIDVTLSKDSELPKTVCNCIILLKELNCSMLWLYDHNKYTHGEFTHFYVILVNVFKHNIYSKLLPNIKHM